MSSSTLWAHASECPRVRWSETERDTSLPLQRLPPSPGRTSGVNTALALPQCVERARRRLATALWRWPMRRRSRAAAASPAKHRSADAAAAPAPKQTSLKRKASGAAPEAAALPAVKAQAVVVSRKASCAVPCLGAARTMEDPLSAEPLESDDAWVRVPPVGVAAGAGKPTGTPFPADAHLFGSPAGRRRRGLLRRGHAVISRLRRRRLRRRGAPPQRGCCHRRDGRDMPGRPGARLVPTSGTQPWRLTPGSCTLPQGRADAQEAAVRDVSGLLGVTPGSASLLLRRFKWNKEDMLSRYMEDPQQVRRAERAHRGCH